MPKFFNEKGEQVLTKEEVAEMSSSSLAKALRMYNRWRRGEGKFQWSEDPKKNKPCPYSPTTLGLLFDAAEKALETR